jgi:hypothetical protein
MSLLRRADQPIHLPETCARIPTIKTLPKAGWFLLIQYIRRQGTRQHAPPMNNCEASGVTWFLDRFPSPATFGLLSELAVRAGTVGETSHIVCTPDIAVAESHPGGFRLGGMIFDLQDC